MALKFEDLIVWRESKSLTIEVFRLYEKNMNFSFKDQIQRACVSIMNNIAEWYDRETEIDRKRFFVIAKWSCAEVRSMLVLSLELSYISVSDYEKLIKNCFWISKMLYSLIQKIKSKAE
jgi:four helix bundle protein